MELQEAQERFIQAWGTLGSSWGINKTMAQIHALLLVSPESLSTEEIMEKLQISRGNANMNIRNLIDWGIVFKEYKSGERKDFFKSEKDIWEVTKQVMQQRRKRELEPLMRVLSQIENVEGAEIEAIKEFKTITGSIKRYGHQAQNILDKFTRADQHWFFGPFLNLFR